MHAREFRLPDDLTQIAQTKQHGTLAAAAWAASQLLKQPCLPGARRPNNDRELLLLQDRLIVSAQASEFNCISAGSSVFDSTSSRAIRRRAA